MNKLYKGIYKNKNVLITGHTGFKGSWLSLWLKELGANVIGYSLEPPTSPNHFKLLNIDIISIIGDIIDKKKLENTFKKYNPDIVFHLAAQTLVRDSYIEPFRTFETNIMGTINVFEACRKTKSVKAIINVTSDKCYENREWVWGYRENDPMGGYDPYSASKGCSELVTSSYRNSFFNLDEYGKKHNVLIASARAGNVIGGGDWAKDRLFPDIVRAKTNNELLVIRNPKSTRPWQHVLEPLSGYLLLGQKLFEGNKNFAEAWNFGPGDKRSMSVSEVVSFIKNLWAPIKIKIENIKNNQHEAGLLKLDCSKAFNKMNWRSFWNSEKALDITIKWYKEHYEKNNLISKQQLIEYVHYMGKTNYYGK